MQQCIRESILYRDHNKRYCLHEPGIPVWKMLTCTSGCPIKVWLSHAWIAGHVEGDGDECGFYYLADSSEGRPRLCGNPNFRTCYHQLQCAECGAYIEAELAEVIERRPGCLQMAVSIPLPEQLVEDLSKQEEGMTIGEPPLPPPIPSPAFHFNKKAVARIEEPSAQNGSKLEQLQARMIELETQLAAKGKQDARNVSIRLLKQDINGLKKRITQAAQEDETNCKYDH